ncbi:pyridoxamine 5'-phosphate oxidase family protein [Candidatus Roizmanbacteria bacterium]|nr:pyridoxamine 5'-phosphate oxidase family protein [Candidatus Roizmanbacteria bacterium]
MTDKQIIDFLTKQRVSVLTTLLKDGSPHAAALHYSHKINPLELYFSTENTSVKCQALLEGNSVKGSVVIGFSEEEWITLQMDGEVTAIFDTDKLKAAQAIHYPKHPKAAQYKDDPATIFLKFIPNWWRYTDYNTDPITILSSEK